MFDHVEELREAVAVLDRLLDEPPEIDAARDATVLIREAEILRRKVETVAIQAHTAIERSEAHRADGHVSAKSMVRHVAGLSHRAAAARERGGRVLRELPEVGAALAAGSLGVDQFDLLGRVHANPRVREAMVDAQEWFVKIARRLSYRDFELEVRRWERLADADGAEPANSKNHETRNFVLLQDHFDLGWSLAGSFAALQGASMHEIHERYADAERRADWEKARAEHGDAATVAHLPRTEAQRRADALWQLFQDAAGAEGSPVGVGFVHDIVWDAATFEEMVRRFCGEPAQPLDPETHRCETIDGVPLEPTEAAADALLGKFRRVVVGGAGVVIDLGRARTFTGGARLAVQLSTSHCPWPGCSVPASRCEIDHTIEYAAGGTTDPGNGGPFCGRHNRWKQKGFSVRRDPTGEWHVYRPDGSEIE